MSREFKLPDLGEGVHEGQVMKLLAGAGDVVKEDDPLMEVETDKAAVEIPSPFAGRIAKWHVEEGQVVNVGDVMVTFDAASNVQQVEQETGSAVRSRAASGAESSKGAAVAAPPSPPTHKPRSTTGRRTPASPATRKLARTYGIDIETIDGSGPGGRVTRADVEQARNGSGAAPAAAPQPVSAARTTAPTPPPPPAAPTPAAAVEPQGQADEDQHGRIIRQPHSQARKTIAANMAQAWSTIPHVTDSDDADVTELDALRRGYPAPENGSRKITMLAFVIRAVAQALRRHPVFNAVFDAENHQTIYRRYINIAVGVHTQRGLVAPVIRDADRMAVLQIADALDAITAKARSASFGINDTRGGTYTISNAGAFGGSRYSTPIVTPGQCAVLAVGRSRWMPWVVGEGAAQRIEPRLIMPLSHSFDHRIADGGEEIAFLQDIINQLQNPARLVL